MLSFVYADRYGNTTTRTAEPYQLVLKGSRWYVHGYCYRRNDYRLFRVSRISGLQISEKRFIPRAYHEPQLDVSNTLEMMHNPIKIRIHASAKERVLDFCTSEQISPDGAEHYLVDFPFIENDYYYNILLSFGDACECLEPMHIRLEMKRRIHRIATLYESSD
ncbi:MAG: WYL domain-containing protein [Sphaerochaetaceae bacterium]|nr:WYL domain-containing protein [uncultured Sphaerochaeta sp.]MDC7229858.1 WYL domain-containing protein [Sphaerochaetaceae bacterium]